DRVYLTGYTPYPSLPQDTRLPHIANKLTSQIHKTALGAETTQTWQQSDDLQIVLDELRDKDYIIAGLEQSAQSVKLDQYTSPDKIALLLGSEVTGIAVDIQKQLDEILEIPMHGQKESFNVVQAAAMALYQLTFH